MSDNNSFAYAAVREAISEQIQHGKLAENQPLAAERDLCEQFQVSRSTLRQALSQLENMGLIYRKNRSGWYVCPRKLRYEPTRHVSFLDYAVAQGFTPTTRLLSVQKIKAGAKLSQLMELDGRSTVTALTRLRAVDGRPVLMEQIYFNQRHFPGLEKQDLSLSINAMLKNHYHHHALSTQISIESCCLFTPAAAHLGVNDGALGLKVQRTLRNAEGEIIEFDEELWRHDALVVENHAHIQM
ncbi:UTRA domain-containing protein [Bowmanella pacifica]|uniref:Transcriptional regulator n=1 Tax=Bowmanella pacifica TaxID=502051 RepID=A0A917YVL2_9ALTE|nr:UTRA domain-containing protein [Bowmanella pacifica]GGO68155.1 transcriptional regulator [Bowmanella pacifica]